MGLVYHLRPEPMDGTTLWPLSRLAAVDASAHTRAMRGYADRPGMVERWVEPLSCSFADCVFLCPVHPEQLQTAMRAGHPDWPTRDWLVVEGDDLDPEDTVLYRPTRWAAGVKPPPVSASRCQAWTPSALAAASVVGQETVTRLANPLNRLPLFVDVVHVLHRGPVAVDPARTIRA